MCGVICRDFAVCQHPIVDASRHAQPIFAEFECFHGRRWLGAAFDEVYEIFDILFRDFRFDFGALGQLWNL